MGYNICSYNIFIHNLSKFVRICEQNGLKNMHLESNLFLTRGATVCKVYAFKRKFYLHAFAVGIKIKGLIYSSKF